MNTTNATLVAISTAFHNASKARVYFVDTHNYSGLCEGNKALATKEVVREATESFLANPSTDNSAAMTGATLLYQWHAK